MPLSLSLDQPPQPPDRTTTRRQRSIDAGTSSGPRFTCPLTTLMCLRCPVPLAENKSL
jgi:hypothetical protein